MKKYFAVLGLSIIAIACAKEIQPVVSPVDPDPITFTSCFSKVLTNGAANEWELNDSISVFSLSNSAEAGVAVDANYIYYASKAGASTSFVPAKTSVSAADKYVAFCPASTQYPSKLNADTATGFAGAAAGAAVTDYRFMPVTVNSNYTAEVNPETRTAKISSEPYFYAVADTPATPGDAVSLTFKPILPILEFGFIGKGEIAKFTPAYADKSVDALGPQNSNWITAKGVFNPTTGVLTTTNTNANAFYKIVVTLSTPVKLSATEPTRFPIVVGRFNITKGLNIVFEDSRGHSFTKTIWTDKTVSGVTAEGQIVHLYQKVNVPYLVSDKESVPTFAAAGASSQVVLETTAGNWSVVSKPSWISLDKSEGANGTLTITAAKNGGLAREGEIVLGCTDGPRCYIAVSQEVAAASDNYKILKSGIEWTDSKIKYVVSTSMDTLAVVTNEFLGASNPVMVTKVYKPDFTGGIELTDAPVYVSADGSTISTSTPSGTVGDASYVDMVLVSPSGESNPLVKLNDRILTITGYKTLKTGNGTDITKISPSAKSTPAVVVGTDAAGKPFYIYNSYAVGASSDGTKSSYTPGFAPEGWSMLSQDDCTEIAAFVGNTTTNAFANFGACGLFTRNTYKLNGTATSQLAYMNTWTTIPDANKLKMWLIQSGKAPAYSSQALTAMFEVLLYKKIN